MKYVFLLVALMSSSAAAREIDFSAHIVDLDGKDIQSAADKGSPPLDLKMVAAMALLSEKPKLDPRQNSEDAAAKLKNFSLAIKIHKGGLVDLSAEEISDLKAAIGAAYPPLVVGRADQLLDPESHKNEK